MDENRARRVADALRDRGIDAHLEKAGAGIYGVRVVLSGGREAIWGNEGTGGAWAGLPGLGGNAGSRPGTAKDSCILRWKRRCML